jgi:uncharacterized membrane protein
VRELYDRGRDSHFATMILQVNADSPWLVRGAATAVLILHISAGGTGLLAGATALLFRKGGRLHRLAGNVFFVSILIMSLIGACVAPFLPQPQWGSVIAGAVTFYLVATSWATVRRREGSVGRFEVGAAAFALGVAVAGVVIGLHERNRTGSLDGSYFVFASVAALAAAFDIRMISRNGVFGVQRIVRHLWRMCVALLIAAVSLFLGQQQVFPRSVQGSPFLFAPEIAILGLLIFWLIRVQFIDWPKPNTADAQEPAGRSRKLPQA